MLKVNLGLLMAFIISLFNGIFFQPSKTINRDVLKIDNDSLPKGFSCPPELLANYYAGPSIVPSPSCLAVAPSGEVFVGVDMIGSLGKTPGKGRIVKLIDNDHNGKMDSHTVFAMVDNPRGIISFGDKLYVLHTTFSKETGKASGMDLVVFEDTNNDGIADGLPQPLVQNICSPKFLQSRGTDHSTNGIRMGIDGWIYISVGDFGFTDAIDRSGKKLTMLGGGIVRVRPDGTELEIFTHGTRNIYDTAIDPFMNIFTRDNTNDGGGWNIRFSHHIQSGEYGYPTLFKNFTEEIIPALVDLGGGSGTGSIFIDDANWPEKYNKVPMMADWGRNQLFVHRIKPDGPTFTQTEEEFIKLSQITDVDVDATGQMYLSAWDGAGYSGNPNKGFVVRVVPKDWKYEAFPNLKKADLALIAKLMKSGSGTARLAAQQELLSRSNMDAAEISWAIASDKSQALDIRVAGIFTYAQAAGASGIPNLVKLANEDSIREIVLKTLADRKAFANQVPLDLFLKSLKDPSPRVQIAATIGLGRLGKIEAAKALLDVKVPATFIAPEKGKEGPHATPNSAIVPPHLTVRALVSLHAVDACVAAIGTKNSTIALWALRYMHHPKAVNGLIAKYKVVKDAKTKREILTTLSRLYKKEAPYDSSWWWSTRPDTHGPYYKDIVWESSPAIKAILLQEWKKATDKTFFVELNDKNRMGIPELGTGETLAAKEEVKVDLQKIRNKKGQVGEASIEDVMLAMAKIPGKAELGKTLFTKQGCIACHSLSTSETIKGPFMGQIGSIMNREQIAESILKPNASISQGFASVLIEAKGDMSYMGFVTEETSTQLTLRDIGGNVSKIKKTDIISRKELETSMMPAGLANALSYEELASLITFLANQKK
ncbi:MAG: c-type cytochrome [Leadbetterella sp.]|nr:c-type cytochrome [Leadbetterella sp.]